MKPCRFRDPGTIASYFDGTMEKALEEEYSRHLLTCRDCAEDLLNLERDLFLMETVEFSRNPRRVTREGALFRLGKEGIELLKKLGAREGAAPRFSPFVLVPVRGGDEKRNGYRWERGEVKVDVLPSGEARVRVDVSGVKGKSLFLYRGKRLIEARSNAADDYICIDDLQKGDYLLFIREFGSFAFTVR
jgi:hypothetical protein